MKQLVILLLMCLAASVAVADFHGDLVDEAIDLGAARPTEDQAEAKSMEDLLHWAIGNIFCLRPDSHPQNCRCSCRIPDCIQC